MSIKQEWQKKWREALGEATDSMPDYREDYVLQFDIWSVGDKKLEECFSIFPKGELLLERVKEVIKSPPKKTEIDDKSLLIKLEQMNQNIESVLNQYADQQLIELNEEKRGCDNRSVYRGNETLRREVLKNADTPTIHLDDELCEIIEKHCGSEGYEAFFFLSEPLYQLGGCYYTVSHWIIWAMVADEFELDPYQPAFDLYKMRAQAGWSNNEQFVFIES